VDRDRSGKRGWKKNERIVANLVVFTAGSEPRPPI